MGLYMSIEGSVTVSSEAEFVEAISEDAYYALEEGPASELWDIWQFRAANGSPGVLVTIPSWLSSDEFDIRRPLIFAQVEYDDPDKGAILYSSASLVDVSIVDNEVWDDVTVTETLEQLDISDTNDYVEDPGKIWLPRSKTTVYELEDEG